MAMQTSSPKNISRDRSFYSRPEPELRVPSSLWTAGRGRGGTYQEQEGTPTISATSLHEPEMTLACWGDALGFGHVTLISGISPFFRRVILGGEGGTVSGQWGVWGHQRIRNSKDQKAMEENAWVITALAMTVTLNPGTLLLVRESLILFVFLWSLPTLI